MKLGQRLREYRKSAGLTLSQLKEKSSLSVSYLSDLERSRVNPSLKTLQLLASIYGVTVMELTQNVEGFTDDAIQTIALPDSLMALKNDPDVGKLLTENDLHSLNKISLRGKQPQTPLEWKEIYLHLRRVLNGGN